jgi:putative aldouronate transport system substrate-binding protein
MKKTFLTRALVLLLVFTMLFGVVGCRKKGNKDQNVQDTKQSTTDAGTKGEPMEITWMVYNQVSGILPDPNSEVLKLIEEKFNVKINVVEVDIHSQEQRNLFWATGNPPDYGEMNADAATKFKLVDQGLLREIPEGYLEKYMPELMENTYEYISKDMVKSQTSYNGKQYILPRVGGSTPYIMAVRQDWLDNLGITKLPETPDELFEILKQFTFNDPDKNNKNDTYGIHGGSMMRYMRFGYVHTYLDVWPDLYNEMDGKIVYTSMTDKYKESLKYLNSWFKAGVVDPEFATEDRNVQRKKWAEGRFGVITDAPWWFSKSTPGNITNMVTDANPNAKITFLEPFKDEQGRQRAQAFYPSCAGDGSGFFGINCTDEKMQKIMEIKNSFAKDWDWYVRAYYGEKDRDYTIVNGVITPKEEATKPEYVTEKGIRQTFALVPQKYEVEKKYLYSEDDIFVYDFAKQFEPMHLYVNFDFTGVNEANNTYGADIRTISEEFYYNAIMGKVDIDKEFENFKERLKAAGVEKVVEEYEKGRSK